MERELLRDTLSLFFEGCFYEAYDNDAYVLSDIFGYRVKERKDGSVRCGFPYPSFETAVKPVLEERKVSYIARKGPEVTSEHDFGSENTYQDYGAGIMAEPFIPRAAREKMTEQVDSPGIALPKSKRSDSPAADGAKIHRPLMILSLPDLTSDISDHGPLIELTVYKEEIIFKFSDGYQLKCMRQ